MEGLLRVGDDCPQHLLPRLGLAPGRVGGGDRQVLERAGRHGREDVHERLRRRLLAGVGAIGRPVVALLRRLVPSEVAGALHDAVAVLLGHVARAQGQRLEAGAGDGGEVQEALADCEEVGSEVLPSGPVGGVACGCGCIMGVDAGGVAGEASDGPGAVRLGGLAWQGSSGRPSPGTGPGGRGRGAGPAGT